MPPGWTVYRAIVAGAMLAVLVALPARADETFTDIICPGSVASVGGSLQRSRPAIPTNSVQNDSLLANLENHRRMTRDIGRLSTTSRPHGWHAGSAKSMRRAII